MPRNALIVEYDPEMLSILKKDLKKYAKAFFPLMAESAPLAKKILKKYRISLVVIDLETAQKAGLDLLAHLNENYPDIHTIAMTNQESAPVSGFRATDYLKKPFILEDLAKKIIDILKTEAQGGVLRGTSPGTFLQLVEMEQKTCSIRLTHEKSNSQGVLFFLEGELLDARLNELRGREAAYQILAWEEANMAIQESCPLTENKVQADLQAVLLEAMRLKDDEEEKAADVKMSQEEIDEYILSERQKQSELELEIEIEVEAEEEPAAMVEEEKPTPPPMERGGERDTKISVSISRTKKDAPSRPAVSYTVADNVIGTLINVKDAVLGSTFIKIVLRIFVFIVAICCVAFSCLYFTMESDKDLTVRIEQAKAYIQKRQETLYALDKEIDNLYSEREYSIKNNESQAVIMEYDLKIADLEERQDKLQAESETKKEVLEQRQAKLEAIKRKSLIERLFERAGDLVKQD